ncbi:MAG: choice-of-anchor tandem repeat GloVer-containing protein [Bryobacteraceae bacterium]
MNWRNRTYAVFTLCAAAAMALPAQTFTTLHSFDGADGEYPIGALVQGVDGSLYGTTSYAGTKCNYPCGGTVFKIALGGTLTTLYDFCAKSECLDGDGPNALLLASDGSLYGTTFYGGANGLSTGPYSGYGTVFKITPAGKLTTLYSFCSQSGCADGRDPEGLVQAANGDLYGTTGFGGICPSTAGCGTVFKLTPGGTLTTLYNFCSQVASNGICTDGEYPNPGLVLTGNGDLYGTTGFGGANIGPEGVGGGTVFKIAASGAFTSLHSFCAQEPDGLCADGSYPRAGLVRAIDGDFYGTTWGFPSNSGTVFRITPGGTFTTLYTFCSESGCADGDHPLGGLVQATDGNFYGTTTNGGPNTGYYGLGGGTVFSISPHGTLKTLYGFCSQGVNCADGEDSFARLVQATNGDFYGTTAIGGTNDSCTDAQNGTCGTAFSLSVGLGPFVRALPHSAKVGAVISILGSDLAGTTGVSFNGTPAAYHIVSPAQLMATVPAGATVGEIDVATPGGLLRSAGPFLVLP